jgi:hypothetical protein
MKLVKSLKRNKHVRFFIAATCPMCSQSVHHCMDATSATLCDIVCDNGHVVIAQDRTKTCQKVYMKSFTKNAHPEVVAVTFETSSGMVVCEMREKRVASGYPSIEPEFPASVPPASECDYELPRLEPERIQEPKSARVEEDDAKFFLGACKEGKLHDLKAFWETLEDKQAIIRANNYGGFWWSCSSGHVDVARWLWSVAEDKQVMIRVDGYYAFRRCCYKGHLHVAQWLWDIAQDKQAMIRAWTYGAFRQSWENDHLDVAEWLWSVVEDASAMLSALNTEKRAAFLKYMRKRAQETEESGKDEDASKIIDTPLVVDCKKAIVEYINKKEAAERESGKFTEEDSAKSIIKALSQETELAYLLLDTDFMNSTTADHLVWFCDRYKNFTRPANFQQPIEVGATYPIKPESLFPQSETPF